MLTTWCAKYAIEVFERIGGGCSLVIINLGGLVGFEFWMINLRKNFFESQKVIFREVVLAGSVSYVKRSLDVDWAIPYFCYQNGFELAAQPL